MKLMRTMSNGTPRIINLILGLWLVASAFAWSHTAAQRGNAIVSGLLTAIMAGSGLHDSQVRYVNVVIGGWLFASGLYMWHDRPATQWNDIVVGILVFIVALLPFNRHAAPA